MDRLSEMRPNHPQSSCAFGSVTAYFEARLTEAPSSRAGHGEHKPGGWDEAARIDKHTGGCLAPKTVRPQGDGENGMLRSAHRLVD